ncbi:MAG: serine hydrolase domain-containing protein [Clostridia bacterium]|nr:serine hydrolase domain-containing protein [Clostridia bacterium]
MTRAREKTLDEGLAYLVDERRIISGISLCYGDLRRAETRVRGNGREWRLENGVFEPAVEPLGPDSLFDLASVTKLFTCVALMQLMERKKLSPEDAVTRYEPRFKHLAGVSVGALMTFSAALSTEARVDAQPDRERALPVLFSARPAPPPARRFYTDMGAMVLKYVIEAAADRPFMDYLTENVLRPLGMTHSFSRIPSALLDRAVCYNYERRIVDGAYWLDTACEKGVVHDPKARLLGADGDLCGHAGLFSTLGDMARFARGLLDGALIRRETLLEIGKNRTGRPLPDGGYTQYLGCLCFVKHPDQTFSEVPRCFSEQAIALNGFCGNHISVDPASDRFMVILSNRIHNRVTMATGRANPHERLETLRWEDGRDYVVSQNYVYCKDENIKDPIGRAFSRL